MPTYDYECDACGHKFEVYQGINDDKLKKCPECKKLKLRRLLGTGGAIMFKGSGFYQTDYRSDSYKKAAAADKPASDSSSGSSSSSNGSSSTSSSSSTGSSSSSDSGKSSKSSESKSKKSGK
ncbi:MAG: FmdB family zinc ribbon protein [Pirellulales bacterium]